MPALFNLIKKRLNQILISILLFNYFVIIIVGAFAKPAPVFTQLAAALA